jgi:hypothetical protein
VQHTICAALFLKGKKAMNSSKPFPRRSCGCGCGKVGRFYFYSSRACKQRAYRNRREQFERVRFHTISTWLRELLGEDETKVIFDHIYQVKGVNNLNHVTLALESIVYLTQSEIRKVQKRQKSKP